MWNAVNTAWLRPSGRFGREITAMKIQRQGLPQPHTLLRNGPHTLRGAALIYALVAVLIISLLILGVGRLVGAHLQYEESSAESSRLIFSAEAAANWQLNRMSRVAPNGAVPALGELSADDLESTSKVWMHLPTSDTGGIAVQDDVYVRTADTQTSGIWSPPHSFTIFAVARDPRNPSVRRGVRFDGISTGIADRYSIFGLNGVTLSGTSSIEFDRGYLGSNGTIECTPDACRRFPAVTCRTEAVFGGMLLTGGNARIINSARCVNSLHFRLGCCAIARQCLLSDDCYHHAKCVP